MFEFADLDAGTWWLIAGILLLALELLAPGVFLVFIGAAALTRRWRRSGPAAGCA